jgi:hypothetical protein
MLRGTEMVAAVSQTIPSGHLAAPRRVYAFYPHSDLLVATFISRFLWDKYGAQDIYWRNGEDLNLNFVVR